MVRARANHGHLVGKGGADGGEAHVIVAQVEDEIAQCAVRPIRGNRYDEATPEALVHPRRALLIVRTVSARTLAMGPCRR